MKPKIIKIKSLEEIHLFINDIVNAYKNDGIVVIRGLSLDKDEYPKLYPEKHIDYEKLPMASDQLYLVKTLGDSLGWFPNSSTDFWDHIIVEDHSRTDLSKFSNDDLIICWHLEHVDYDTTIPLLASVWSMWHLEISDDQSSGNTWFLDSQKIYELLDQDDANFLSKSVLSWYDIDESGPHISPAIHKHWLTEKPIVRIEITPDVRTILYMFDEREPTESEINKFNNIKEKLMTIINSAENKIVHSWKQWDVVIPDLQRMAHTVTGGFQSKDRKFTNFFTYLKDPYKLSEEEKPFIWKNEWIEKKYGNV